MGLAARKPQPSTPFDDLEIESSMEFGDSLFRIYNRTPMEMLDLISIDDGILSIALAEFIAIEDETTLSDTLFHFFLTRFEIDSSIDIEVFQNFTEQLIEDDTSIPIPGDGENSYTLNIGLANPDLSGFGWQDEWYRNTDISDVLFFSLLNQNRLISGGKVTTTDNINALYEAGSAWIDGITVPWMAGSLEPFFDTTGLDFYLNWIYVNSSSVVSISTTKPTGDFVLLGVLDVGNSQILRIFDIRNFKESVPIDGSNLPTIIDGGSFN